MERETFVAAGMKPFVVGVETEDVVEDFADEREDGRQGGIVFGVPAVAAEVGKLFVLQDVFDVAHVLDERDNADAVGAGAGEKVFEFGFGEGEGMTEMGVGAVREFVFVFEEEGVDLVVGQRVEPAEEVVLAVHDVFEIEMHAADGEIRPVGDTNFGDGLVAGEGEELPEGGAGAEEAGGMMGGGSGAGGAGDEGVGFRGFVGRWVDGEVGGAVGPAGTAVGETPVGTGLPSTRAEFDLLRVGQQGQGAVEEVAHAGVLLRAETGFNGIRLEWGARRCYRQRAS